MNGFHFLDFLAIFGYLAVVLYLGRRAAHKADSNEEGYFLAGRGLGKVYQFFLNFGNATDANGAVSTASLVYQKGVSGVWLSLQTLFMTPYYWFMNVWFRRVRLVTVADLFEDRFGSKALARFYAIFQIVATVIVIIGFGNLVSYKVTASLLLKDEAKWTVEERASVEGYLEFQTLKEGFQEGILTAEQLQRLEDLDDMDKRGELRSNISYLDSTAGKWSYYVIYSLVVGGYIVMGGLAAAAINEAFQGILIIVFSILLIPGGLKAIGGWGALADKVPQENFQLLSSGGIGIWELVGVFLISINPIQGIIGNMGVSGSATNEFAARFGATSGTFAKRLMIILWAIAGLIAIALYQNSTSLSDPDSAWGAMALQLLGPGFLGLMMAGLLAANMSTIAAQTMAVSALFTRNVYKYLVPHASQKNLIFTGRIAIVAILSCGIIAAASMNDVYAVIQLLLTVNVPFGASVLLIFFWRKLTLAAVWTTVVVSALVNIVAPAWLAYAVPSLRESPALVQEVTLEDGSTSAVFFESVVRSDPDNPESARYGQGRLHLEIYTLSLLGVPVEDMSPSVRNASRYIYDAFFPFLVLLLVSLFTRKPEAQRVDRFFGKMKTPVGATPEEEEAAMAETYANPHRFDHTKLFPNSSWEFTKWNKLDAVGFAVCVGISFSILGIFWFILRLAAT
ncbi:MAG: sodium:solute symporter [Puniceicoccaceae bacterium]